MFVSFWVQCHRIKTRLWIHCLHDLILCRQLHLFHFPLFNFYSVKLYHIHHLTCHSYCWSQMGLCYWNMLVSLLRWRLIILRSYSPVVTMWLLDIHVVYGIRRYWEIVSALSCIDLLGKSLISMRTQSRMSKSRIELYKNIWVYCLVTNGIIFQNSSGL